MTPMGTAKAYAWFVVNERSKRVQIAKLYYCSLERAREWAAEIRVKNPEQGIDVDWTQEREII